MTTLDLLRLVPPLRQIPPLHLHRIAQQATLESIAPGQRYLRALLPPRPASYLANGLVAPHCPNGEFNTAPLLYPLRKGWISLSATLQEHTSPPHLLILDKSQIVTLPREEFIAAIRTNPEFALHIAQICALEATCAQEQIGRLTSTPVAKRLAELLLHFAQEIYASPSYTLPTDQETLARFVGCSREVLNRTLQELRKKKLIILNRRQITILEPLRLKGMKG